MKLHPDSQNILDIIRNSGRPPSHEMSVGQARAAYAAGRDATMGPPQAVASIEDFEIEGPGGPITIRLYRAQPKDAGPAALLIYFHGGGWVLGGIESHDGLCRRLAAGANCAVASIEYRLAPEHPFPAAIEDASTAVNILSEMAAALGFDPNRISVGGDSAGGTLAAVAAVSARDAGGPPLAYQLLLYPVCDMAMDTASQRSFAEGYLLTGATLRWFGKHYLGDTDWEDWRASPLRTASVAGLPPTLVLTASHDPLRDEGEAYARRLIEAGVPTVTWRVEGMLHGFLPMDKLILNAAPTVETISRLLALGLGASQPPQASASVPS